MKMNIEDRFALDCEYTRRQIRKNDTIYPRKISWDKHGHVRNYDPKHQGGKGYPNPKLHIYQDGRMTVLAPSRRLR